MVVRVLRRVDDGAGGAQAGALHHLGPEVPARDRQPGDDGPDLVDVRARVQQGAERHVPGDAGEAVEPGQGHPPAPSGPTGPLVADAGDGAGRAEAVVDADDGHALRAGAEHGQEGGDATEGRAVAGARGHGGRGTHRYAQTTQSEG